MKEGLVIKDLGDICHFQNGFAFKSKTFKEFGEPVVRITNIQNDRVESKGFVFVDRNDYSQDLSKYEVRKGDLLIAMSGATTGKIGLYRSEKILLLNQRVGLFKPSQSLDKQYLYYFLSTKVEESLAISAGAAQPNLSTEQIKAFQIPLPPLPEQQRIVSILDKAFAAIDQAKANAEQNLKNAKELFESYLQGVFENGDWETKVFNEVCEISSKLIDPKKTEYQNLIHVGAGNIEAMTGELSNLKTAKEENLISGKFLFDKSMVLYSKIRPYLMKVVNCDFQGLCSADIYPLKPFEKVISKDYLYHLLLTKEFTEYAIQGSQRAGMPKVNRKHLFEYRFKLPSLIEQQSIVRKLDALQAETQKLEAVYQKKMDDLEELKKSVLQKAFAGELKVSELGFDGLKDDMILEKDKT
jgi:type I restriction enzyme S subunit